MNELMLCELARMTRDERLREASRDRRASEAAEGQSHAAAAGSRRGFGFIRRITG